MKNQELVDVGSALQRLQRSIRWYVEPHYYQGLNDGVEWAQWYAEAIHLVRLADSGDLMVNWRPSVSERPSQLFLAIIAPLGADPGVTMTRFRHPKVEKRYRVRMNNREYVRGFVAGAVSVWQEVKNEVLKYVPDPVLLVSGHSFNGQNMIKARGGDDGLNGTQPTNTA